MRRRTTISLIVVAVVIVVTAVTGVIVYYCLNTGAVHGAVEFGKKYYLTEIRDNVYDGVSINHNSYLQLNEDHQTGELSLVGLAEGKIDFIVTKYTEGVKNTTFEIEFIYHKKLQTLTATSTDNAIYFYQVQPSRVEITQENPDGTHYLEYSVKIMAFAKEVA